MLSYPFQAFGGIQSDLCLEDDVIIIIAFMAAGRQGDQRCMLLSFLIFARLKLPSRPDGNSHCTIHLIPTIPSLHVFIVSN